jgi:uncharacterized membrane protein
VVVGESSSDVLRDDNGPITREAFTWTEERGMHGLGLLPGGSRSVAYGVSADGSVIVGESSSVIGLEIFWWTASSGMSGLGIAPPKINWPGRSWRAKPDGSLSIVDDDGRIFHLSPGDSSLRTSTIINDLPGANEDTGVRDISLRGNVAVGSSRLLAEGQVAFIWTPEAGLRSLKDVLINDFGLPLDGWSLSIAFAVSDDGQAIVGSGLNPDGNTEAWLVRLVAPQPTAVTQKAWGNLKRR